MLVGELQADLGILQAHVVGVPNPETGSKPVAILNQQSRITPELVKKLKDLILKDAGFEDELEAVLTLGDFKLDVLLPLNKSRKVMKAELRRIVEEHT